MINDDIAKEKAVFKGIGIVAGCLGMFMMSSLYAKEVAVSAVALSFEKFDQKARNGESLSVVFLGGSLTWGAKATNPQLTSYRALTSQKLEKAYPKAHFQFWDAAIGGTGSQLAAFRLERDVLSHKPDLVFLDFTINDSPYVQPDPDRLASYESLIRRVLLVGAPVVQVILPAKEDLVPNPRVRLLDPSHKAIGEAYGLPIADAVALVKEKVSKKIETPDTLWDVPSDRTHPGDRGYAVYSEAAWAAYQQAVQNKMVCKIPDKMVNADTYMTLSRNHVAKFKSLPKGWGVGQLYRDAIAYDFIPSRWMDDVAVAGYPKEGVAAPAPLVLKVKTTNILLFGESIPTSGKYAVKIDDGEAKVYDSGGNLSKNGNLRYVEIIAHGLDPQKEHKVEIIPQLEPGQELRLESICLSGATAKIL